MTTSSTTPPPPPSYVPLHFPNFQSTLATAPALGSLLCMVLSCLGVVPDHTLRRRTHTGCICACWKDPAGFFFSLSGLLMNSPHIYIYTALPGILCRAGTDYLTAGVLTRRKILLSLPSTHNINYGTKQPPTPFNRRDCHDNGDGGGGGGPDGEDTAKWWEHGVSLVGPRRHMVGIKRIVGCIA
jgi:hypothetical protein